MKVSIELEGSFGNKFALETNYPKFNTIISQKRFDAVVFALRNKTYKRGGIRFRFKVNKMFEPSGYANNEFLEIMLVYFVFGLLNTQCLIGVNFIDFEKFVQNE